jgi:NAD(P)-dependent dehydrogenase (short-subunit alcohol dehydrogenase family)
MVDNVSYGRHVAVITGAYGGIGLACARRLGRNHDLVDAGTLDLVIAAASNAGPLGHAGRCRRRGRVPGLGPGVVHHGIRSSGRRRRDRQAPHDARVLMTR